MELNEWLSFFFAGWGLLVPIYIVLQVASLIILRGTYRVVCAIPLPVMVIAAVTTFVAYKAEANLWPIPMIFATPLAVVFLIVILSVGWSDKRKVAARLAAGQK